VRWRLFRRAFLLAACSCLVACSGDDAPSPSDAGVADSGGVGRDAAGPCGSCAAGKTCCNDIALGRYVCEDLQTGAEGSCGTCNTSCNIGARCEMGRCVP